MRTAHYPLTHLPARGLLFLLDQGKQLEMRFKQKFPALLGLPAMGPYVQFYRQDAHFKTELSLFNYFSSFLPKVPVGMDYEVAAYNRNGSRISSGRITLAEEQSAQAELGDIIGKPLDEYGLFHVRALPRSNSPAAAVQVGTTAGQFMTLFRPTDSTRQAPQLIHSHKVFQKMPILYSPYTRKSSFTEELSTVKFTEFFFLNPCPTPTRAALRIFDAGTGEALETIKCKIGGHSVERIVLKKDALPGKRKVLAFTYDFGRRISHMKPILFHHHEDDVITCNHT